VLVAAAVLIAAEDDLYAARFQRDGALAIERRHAQRVERYEAYFQAVQRRDPTVVRSLLAGQLRESPTDLVEEHLPGVPVFDPGPVFASLEPPEAEVPSRVRVDSVLARWATDDTSRVWLMASGAMCVFVGLLPPVRRRAGARGVPPLDQDDLAGDAPEPESPPDGAEGPDELDAGQAARAGDAGQEEGACSDEASASSSSDPA
jgi:hypothetical protein